MESNNSIHEPNQYVNLPKLFFGLIKFVIRKVKVIIASIIVTSLLTYLYCNYVMKPLYKSNLVLQSEFIQIEDMGILLRHLNELIESESYQQLGDALSLNPEEAKCLKRFNVKLVDYNKTEKEKSIIKLEEKFDVQVTVSNSQVLGKLNKGFLDYISSNAYLGPQIKVSQKLYVDLLQQISRELRSLDSLKKSINRSIVADKSQNIMFLTSPSDISRAIIDLHEKQAKLEKSLIFKNGFQSIQSFSPNVPDTNLRLVQLLVLANLIGFILTVIVLGIIDLGKRVS